ncbi:MAG: hypothetical protein GOVbin3762_24 [Prokaryotic dsDNA virus sp.]|nr:MAG: hypothetical protein GOVbin3762_24 [Prokaryotic dsDNA virus sp.]
MKVIEALKIQSILDKKEIPCDMHDELTYYSESQDKYIKVHDMDITHLVRAFLSMQEKYNVALHNFLNQHMTQKIRDEKNKRKS